MAKTFVSYLETLILSIPEMIEPYFGGRKIFDQFQKCKNQLFLGPETPELYLEIKNRIESIGHLLSMICDSSLQFVFASVSELHQYVKVILQTNI